MRKEKGTGVWECRCGKIAYGKIPPEECKECDSINSFTSVPEDLVDEMLEKNILSGKIEGSENEIEEEYENDL